MDIITRKLAEGVRKILGEASLVHLANLYAMSSQNRLTETNFFEIINETMIRQTREGIYFAGWDSRLFENKKIKSSIRERLEEGVSLIGVSQERRYFEGLHRDFPNQVDVINSNLKQNYECMVTDDFGICVWDYSRRSTNIFELDVPYRGYVVCHNDNRVRERNRKICGSIQSKMSRLKEENNYQI